MDVPRSKAKVGVPGYVRCKRVRRPFTSDVPRYIVWGNTRARYILWAGYIYAWFVHGLIWVDPDRAYIMHARADESTEHNRLDYYWTFYAISVALNCAHHEWVTVHLLPIHLDTVVPRGTYSYSTVAVKAFFAKGHSRCTWVHVPRYTYFGMQISEERPLVVY